VICGATVRATRRPASTRARASRLRCVRSRRRLSRSGRTRAGPAAYQKGGQLLRRPCLLPRLLHPWRFDGERGIARDVLPLHGVVQRTTEDEVVMRRAGLPAYLPGSSSLVTTLPAPTTQPGAIRTPGRIMHLAPIQHPSPTMMGLPMTL